MGAMTETAEERVVRIYATLGTDDRDDITSALMSELGLSAKAQEVLRPWVFDRVSHTLVRMYSRHADSQPPVPPNGSTTRHKAGTTAGRSAWPDRGPLWFMGDTCKVLCPDAPEGFKLYRELTAADHLSRILIHNRNIDGASKSKRTHEWAISELDAHSAACLADIPLSTLEADLPAFEMRK